MKFSWRPKQGSREVYLTYIYIYFINVKEFNLKIDTKCPKKSVYCVPLLNC